MYAYEYQIQLLAYKMRNENADRNSQRKDRLHHVVGHNQCSKCVSLQELYYETVHSASDLCDGCDL